ncbi:hypothetical protein [Selenomonas ruminantium]|uniref:Capsule polysaccharide biosynthesis protein n=1 Tax=Selenomonas ruminantium TaxID=971 RepID=A0A1K1NRF5_SELRU|nr:hypothetical protein [Selenomonas ruminantium]SFW37006.1 hypothetical protein SAMN02910323_1533 [Selenomonas ruminantium]
MNILISAIANDYTDDWITRILSKLDIENCGICYSTLEFARDSYSIKYTTCYFLHTKMKEGDYSDYEKMMYEAPPVDSQLLRNMSQYENQVFWMMERCDSADFNTRWEHYIKHLRFWNHVLDKMNIDIYFSVTTTHEVYDFIIYCLCKIKGIKYISGFAFSYYSRYHLLEDIYNPLPTFKNEMMSLMDACMDKTIDEIILKPEVQEMYDFYVGSGDRTPYYMKLSKIHFRHEIFNCLYNNFALARMVVNLKIKLCNKRYVRAFWYFLYRVNFIFGAFIRLFSWSINAYKWFEKKKYSTRIFNEFDVALEYYNENIDDIDIKKKYIYVALHLQPENTSSPLGGDYVDQALMIEMLSFFLPKNWLLYVKENPKQAMQDFKYDRSLYRSVHFYERIKKCKNVKLVSIQEDTYKLIDNAMAVATLTGTVGLEAITKGIPCLMFGHSYLQYAPNVYTVRTNNDCKRAIENIQQKKSNDTLYYKKIKIYFKALEKYVAVATPEYQLLNEDEIERSKVALSNAFYKKIKSMYKDHIREESRGKSEGICFERSDHT